MIRAFFTFVFTCACINMEAQVNYIKTICGKGGIDSAGYCCDGDLAIYAKLYYPQALYIDRFDNIYIADPGNNRIRKIDHTTNIITTIAGNGTGGYFGDNGLATDAQLFIPEAVIVDSNGNIYIADAENNVIRKIDATTNIITTFAGNGIAGSDGDNGLAVNAELNKPCGLCFDKSGNIIIADEHSDKVRKIDISTGIITTVAGSGVIGYSGDNGPATNAKLYGPFQVFTDSSDNIIFSDGYNNVVRKVDHSTGIITTIAGDGTAGFAGDNGLAIHAEFYLPFGIFIDKQQNIYIADNGNGEVRKIDAQTGIITAVAGNGTLGYSGDNGPATAAQLVPTDVFFDSNGNMFITDAGNNCIREVYNPLGVKQTTQESKIMAVYPNPTTGKFVLKIIDSKEPSDIYIGNALGEKVFETTTNSAQTIMDLSAQPSGLYVLHVQIGDEHIVQKIAVSH